ncbi:Membrane protein of ER body 1 [Spatholobus suberectus]|nr:Membrane protein of ER body 1 [Spatholobus suberectus]
MDHPEGSDQIFTGTPQYETLEPDQSKKQLNQSKGEVGYMDHPKSSDHKFKGAPQHEAPKLDQSKKQMNQSKGEVDYMDQPKGPNQKFKGAPQQEALEPYQSKEQMNQSEGEVSYIDHPEGLDQKFKDAPPHEAPKPDQSKKQMNEFEGEVSYTNHPEGSDQKFKRVPQHETLEPDQSMKQMNQFEGEVGHKDHPKGLDQKFKGAPQHKAPKPDQPKKQMNQLEGDATKVEDKINGTGLESFSRNIPGNKKSEDSPSHSSATSQDQGKGQIAPKKKHFWSNWAVIGDAFEAFIPKQPKTSTSKKSEKQPEIDLPDEKQQEHIEVKIDEADTEPVEVVTPAESTPLLTRTEPTLPSSSKKLEILKSIVYGGLIESLASLSVVTSAASADATTLNIVALAIANLIGGLFVLGHNLEELKSEQVDRYNELLGQRENFILHAFIAVLSFIVFGLVPPVVYGFSFRESDDKDFKVAAVAGASLLCITLLSIAKAYIKRPNSYMTYFKTVLYYVSTGAVASVLSYLAGDLVKKLIEKLGWFESASFWI